MQLFTATNIVLGRGRVFFDRFAAGTMLGEGERYIGNTTGFSLQRDVDQVERVRSQRGQLIKSSAHITQEKQRGGFVTDNIVIENIALWFGDEAVDYSPQMAIGLYNESFVVRRGRYYQLGRTFNILGVRFVENLTFKIDGVVVNPTYLEVDPIEGRFQVLPEAAIPNGSTIDVTFEWRVSASKAVTVSRPLEMLGSLRFIATNPVGGLKHYFMPYVSISATGDFSLKGDEWQQIGFDFEIRKLNPSTPFICVLDTAPAGLTGDEQAIVDLGGIPLDEFPYWEDQLHVLVNVTMPAHDYLP